MLETAALFLIEFSKCHWRCYLRCGNYFHTHSPSHQAYWAGILYGKHLYFSREQLLWSVEKCVCVFGCRPHNRKHLIKDFHNSFSRPLANSSSVLFRWVYDYEIHGMFLRVLETIATNACLLPANTISHLFLWSLGVGCYAGARNRHVRWEIEHVAAEHGLRKHFALSKRGRPSKASDNIKDKRVRRPSGRCQIADKIGVECFNSSTISSNVSFMLEWLRLGFRTSIDFRRCVSVPATDLLLVAPIDRWKWLMQAAVNRSARRRPTKPTKQIYVATHAPSAPNTNLNR